MKHVYGKSCVRLFAFIAPLLFFSACDTDLPGASENSDDVVDMKLQPEPDEAGDDDGNGNDSGNDGNAIADSNNGSIVLLSSNEAQGSTEQSSGETQSGSNSAVGGNQSEVRAGDFTTPAGVTTTVRTNPAGRNISPYVFTQNWTVNATNDVTEVLIRAPAVSAGARAYAWGTDFTGALARPTSQQNQLTVALTRSGVYRMRVTFRNGSQSFFELRHWVTAIAGCSLPTNQDPKLSGAFPFSEPVANFGEAIVIFVNPTAEYVAPLSRFAIAKGGSPQTAPLIAAVIDLVETWAELHQGPVPLVVVGNLPSSKGIQTLGRGVRSLVSQITWLSSCPDAVRLQQLATTSRAVVTAPNGALWVPVQGAALSNALVAANGGIGFYSANQFIPYSL